jgi:resuscitation-promoting factor RpfB
MRTHRSTSIALLFVILAVGTLLTWTQRPALAEGSTPSRSAAGSLPGYRSVVVGATVVSLAALNLPGPTTVPTVPPPPAPVVPPVVVPPPSPGPPTFPLGGVWAALRQCESGGNYATDTGNGYYGAYQFSASTWHGLGLSGLPSQAPPATQDAAAVELQARSGWGQWPACSRRLGLR